MPRQISTHPRRALLAVLPALAFGLSAIGATAQDAFPDPSDEAALYEAAKQEGSLTWYVSGPLEAHQAIARDFEAKYPGVSVQIGRYVGVAQYQKFMQETEAGSNVADVLHLSDVPSVQSLAEEGYIAHWKVPTFDRYPEDVRIDDEAYAPNYVETAIVFNVNTVTPEEIELLKSGWEALLDPRFKGRYALTTQKCAVCYMGIHMFLDPALDDRYGPDFLEQVAANSAASYSETLLTLDRVIAGEHDLAVWNWESSALAKWVVGAPIGWVFPKPTPRSAVVYTAVSALAPHPNAARLFQNWYLSDEGAESIQRGAGNVSTLEGAVDIRQLPTDSWYSPIEETYPIDWGRWQTNFDTDMDLWIQIQQQSRQ